MKLKKEVFQKLEFTEYQGRHITLTLLNGIYLLPARVPHLTLHSIGHRSVVFSPSLPPSFTPSRFKKRTCKGIAAYSPSLTVAFTRAHARTHARAGK